MRELRVLGHYLSFPLVVLSLLDALVLGGAWYALFARGDVPANIPAVLVALVGAGIAFLTNAAVGLYHIQLRVSATGVLGRSLVAFLLGIPLATAAGLLLPLHWNEVVFAFAVGAMAYGILGLVHAVFFSMADAGLLRRRVLVLGERETTGLTQMRRRADRRGFEVVGFIAGTAELGGLSLGDYARRLAVDEVVVALKDRRGALPVGTLMEMRLSGISVVDLATFVEREAGKLRLDLLQPARMVFDANCVGAVQEAVKRGFDVGGALLLLLLSLPVTLATVLAIKREEGWSAPILYRQERVGKGGRSFQVLKFRSMRVDAEADGKARWATRDDDRVTRVGRVIRKLRIDELPQLLNVLRGEMSLVGPRPERPTFVAELEQHIPYYALRHRIKPGVTGWAQLLYPYGASRADAAEKLQFDLYYLKNRSIVLDLIILLQTVEVVLFGKGAR